MPRLRFPALLLALACSGAASLTYQILWLRLLSLVFGVTAYAASTVLAGFMAGLAVGSLLSARFAGRVRRPLRLLAVAELAIATAALVSAYVLERLPADLGSVLAAATESPATVTLVRLLGTMAILLVPTTTMGATLPLAVASSLARAGRRASRLAAVYGTNTAGAIAGALATGYVLMGAAGMRRSFWIAAGVNAAAALVVLWLARGEEAGAAVPLRDGARGHDAAETRDGVAPDPTRGRRAALVALAASGAASLALEVVWFRILVLFVPATAYAFTTMLATVLGGIAAGGWLAARWLRGDRDWWHALATIYAATGALVVASLAALAWTYAAGWRTSGLTQASVVAIFPAALLMGAAFPIAIRLLAADARGGADPADLGRGYAVNVAGAILGALAGGFLLLPRLGSRASLIVCAAVYVLAAAWLGWHAPRRRRTLGTIAGGTAAFAIGAWLTPDPFDATLHRRHGSTGRILWKEEGVQTTVSVNEEAGRRVLYLDGLHQANDTPEMLLTHRQIGSLPMALHPNPRRALVIGLGGGATAGAVSRHAGTAVDVVELSDTVRKGAAWFAHANDNVLRRPNVRFRVDDGRNYLLTTRERYDVVTADIIQPIHAGAGLLYSTEYYALARGVLNEDGLMLQWVGHRPDAQYRLIVRSFQQVFPETTLWANGTLLVGSVRPLTVSRSAFDAKRREPSTRAALDAVGLDSFESLRSWFVAGPRALRAFIGDGEVLTDDRPRIEYHRSLPAESGDVDLTGLQADSRELTVID